MLAPGEIYHSVLPMAVGYAGCIQWFADFHHKGTKSQRRTKKKQKNADHDMLVRLCAYFVRLCVLCGECVCIGSSLLDSYDPSLAKLRSRDPASAG